ncbi:transporter [Candidatus Saccharibacteria bacterium HGW-Saccharibacteria-1]|jgi:predicted transport protein|nr:MAG: transporter [Candidatus Saccharibacteria bacterium HGW-Saccharibacteria-1]
MSLFKLKGKDATRLNPVTIREGKKTLERDIQKIFEDNLEELLNVVFLAHEYPTSFGGRMDTLGIDTEGNPCIIEYKKGQNDSVINQGLSYLRWLLDHKDSFEKLCSEKNIVMQIQWSAPRVICIAESYNKFDADTADLLPINIELLKYRLYEDDLLILDTENYQKVKISDKPKFISDISIKQEKLQEVYTVEGHLVLADAKTQELFRTLKEAILSIDQNIVEESKKLYVAYKMTRNFVDIVFKKNKLKLFINVKSGKLDDPQGIARNLETPVHIGHWGNGDYEVALASPDEIDYVMGLIRQSYELNQ